MATIPASENIFPVLRMAEGAAPSTPPSAETVLYTKSDGRIYWKDDAGTEYSVAALADIPAAGLSDQDAFTYLDATEAAAPATPASGFVRVYAKSDGRVYSKDDAGVEFGPFDAAGGGGADLTGLRLSGVRDDPADIPLGTYGDEFEYDSLADLLAVWTKTNGTSGTLADAAIVPGGSHVMIDSGGIDGRGIVKTGLTLPADFEVAALFTHTGGNMCGVGIHNGTGGILAVNYVGNGYTMTQGSNYQYAGTGSNGGAPPTWGPLWIALRRSSGNWRYRFSVDGTSWTTAVASTASPTVSGADRIWLGTAFTGRQAPTIHRLVYGTPDLGL